MKIAQYFFLLLLFHLSEPIEAQDSISKKDLLFQKYISDDDTEEQTAIDFKSPKTDSIQHALFVEKTNASIEYYRKLVSDYHHTQKVFEWQLISSYIIFWIVIIIVLSGIVLSWLQFTKSGPHVTDAAGTPISSAFKFSLKSGFEVTSPVLGVLILVISLAFFYLYLIKVYQIRILK